MIPLRLYIKNFMCYERAFIDFTQFSSALILGKVANNDLYSNGAGKTTIFKAIEYVLFNQAEVNLNDIIRESTNGCEVAFDFSIADSEYRLIRRRTLTGVSDLSLYIRTAEVGSVQEVQHDISESPITFEKYWKPITSRRAGDTEKDLAKLIKINYKSFRGHVHFVQNDFSGITTATPEKRKGILKDALNIVVYSKLEKLAKEKYSVLSKEYDKNKSLLDLIGNPEDDIKRIELEMGLIDSSISSTELGISAYNEALSDDTMQLNVLSNKYNNLSEKSVELASNEKKSINDLRTLESSLKNFSSKKESTLAAAKQQVLQIKALEEKIKLVEGIDYDKSISKHSNDIISIKERLAEKKLTITNQKEQIAELSLPMPKDGVCKHCRQELTEEHRANCHKRDKEKIAELNESNRLLEQSILELNGSARSIDAMLSKCRQDKSAYENMIREISSNKSEVTQKKKLYAEYSDIVIKLEADIQGKNKEIDFIRSEIKKSSMAEADAIKKQMIDKKCAIDSAKTNILRENKILQDYSNKKAVLCHDLEAASKNKAKMVQIMEILEEYDSKMKIYPQVIESFSTTGIPNIIIQNVLDDLQIESNKLLNLLKPGLQLSFVVEKVKGSDEGGDTLDINYFLQNRPRNFAQLSGAQKFAVTFSLKLGLSFLLQKMMGIDIKMLLLDEIDQSLDKGSAWYFADIIKTIQSDYKILVITHKDWLKDKFTNTILVEQNEELVSTARVM